MLLAEGDYSRFFHYGQSDSGVGTSADDTSEECIQIPSVRCCCSLLVVGCWCQLFGAFLADA